MTDITELLYYAGVILIDNETIICAYYIPSFWNSVGSN